MAFQISSGENHATAVRLTLGSLVTMLLFTLAKPSFSGSLQPVEDFGSNPGQLNMYVYLPEGYEPESTLVVALHGCVQQASGFDDETGLTGQAMDECT